MEQPKLDLPAQPATPTMSPPESKRRPRKVTDELHALLRPLTKPPLPDADFELPPEPEGSSFVLSDESRKEEPLPPDKIIPCSKCGGAILVQHWVGDPAQGITVESEFVGPAGECSSCNKKKPEPEPEPEPDEAAIDPEAILHDMEIREKAVKLHVCDVGAAALLPLEELENMVEFLEKAGATVPVEVDPNKLDPVEIIGSLLSFQQILNGNLTPMIGKCARCQYLAEHVAKDCVCHRARAYLEQANATP